MLCKALFLAERITDGAVKNFYILRKAPFNHEGVGLLLFRQGFGEDDPET